MEESAAVDLDAKKREPPYYRRMWKRVVVSLLAVSITPLILIGGGMYYYATSVLKHRTVESLSQEVIKHQKTIDQFLIERTMDLKLLANTMSLSSLIQPGALKGVFDSLRHEGAYFVDLGIISDQGEHLAYTGPYDLLQENYRNTEWFGAVMDDGLYISDIFLGYRKVPHFVIALRQISNHNIWIIRATIDTAYFNTLVSEVLGTRTGDTYLVNQEGIFQTTPRIAGELMGQSEFKDVKHFEGVNLEERQHQLCAMIWLKKVPWLCVVELDKNEIFAALHHVRNMGIGVFVLGAILIVVTVLVTTNYLVSRLEIKRRNIIFLGNQLRHTSTVASSMSLLTGFIREINETMNTIGTAARWIQDLVQNEIPDEKSSHEITESLTQIKSEVKRSRKITDKILSLTRYSVPIIKEMQTNEVIDDVLELLDRELKTNNIKVIQDYDDHLPLIRSDPPQLRQVFQNLLLRSLASVQKDGKIVITTRRRVGGVSVTLTDNGPGLPNKQLGRLFDPSFTFKPGETDTGLGLSLSAGILEKLGGRISVQSEHDKGTSFIVELPFHGRASSS